MVKGVTRRVIVIKSPDRHLFDEAIFLVREDALREDGVTSEQIVQQAQQVADHYVRFHLKKRWINRLPSAAFAGLGAAGTALVWLLTQLL